MKTLAMVAGLTGLILTAYGMADAVDRHTEARLELAQAFKDGCLPKAGETAIIVSDGRVARCRILSTRSVSPGFAPRLVSAAVVDLEAAP